MIRTITTKAEHLEKGDLVFDIEPCDLKLKPILFEINRINLKKRSMVLENITENNTYTINTDDGKYEFPYNDQLWYKLKTK